MSGQPSYAMAFGVDGNTLPQVIALGDANRQTLGFLPHAGYQDAAEREHLVVAKGDDGEVAGYCLFDLPRDIVRIVHVCVRHDHRGHGLARLLVDAVSERHRDRLGLRLKCRPDWAADGMWRELGFVAQSQVIGRSKAGHQLTIWWRSHGHDDLFTLLEEQRAAGRPAAIDSNVYSDLHTTRRSERQGANQSAILAPLIAGLEINVVLLPSVAHELYSTPEEAQRKRFLAERINYTEATHRADPEATTGLLARVPEEVLAKDPSLRDDAELIAEADANAVDVFVTRDQNCLDWLTEPAADLFGVEVVHPTDVPTLLDREQAGESYEPRRLEETSYTVRRAGPGAFSRIERDLVLNKARGERRVQLTARLADLASRSAAEVTRRVLADDTEATLAAWATQTANNTVGPASAGGTPARLEVPLLRVVPGSLAPTLATQLSHLLRTYAADEGHSVIRVTDPFISDQVREALHADGYTATGDTLTALSVDTIGTWAEVSAAAKSVAESAGDPGLTFMELPEQPSTAQAANLERRWRPAKILNAGIENWIVSIRPTFAAMLLGYEPTIFDRDDLGLSRELVYYSAASGLPRPPARILWYASGQEGSVVATSRLIETTRDTPRRLHRRFARLGVWNLEDITRGESKSGRIGALRFVDTELFSHRVPYTRVCELTGKGRHLSLQSPERVADVCFERIYREGRER